MAIHRISILGAHTVPDSSGNVFLEPYSIKATNGTWKYLILVFNPGSAREGVYGKFAVPANYVSGAGLRIRWTSTAISGDVEWDFDYRAVGGNDTESLDQATAQESVNANDTAPSATDERMDILIPLTDGNFEAGDSVPFFFAHDGTDIGDTIAAAMQVHGAFFEYADD